MTFDSQSLNLGPLEDTFLQGVIQSAEGQFLEFGVVRPQVIFMKQNKMGVILVADFTEEFHKDGISELIRDLRQDSQAVAFINESWVSMNVLPDDSRPKSEKIEEAISKLKTGKAPMPSKAPNREEAVGVFLYVGKRTVIIMGTMKRPSQKIEKFEVVSDSGDKEDYQTGRFI